MWTRGDEHSETRRHGNAGDSSAFGGDDEFAIGDMRVANIESSATAKGTVMAEQDEEAKVNGRNGKDARERILGHSDRTGRGTRHTGHSNGETEGRAICV